MSKHTPGPWTFDGPDGWQSLDVVARHGGGNETTVAIANSIDSSFAPDDETGIGNASLIAAAPELLAALQAYVSADDECMGDSIGGDIRNAARAAIAKATGA